MSNLAVRTFDRVKDILIYIATATHEVTTLELEEYVVDLNRTQINLVIKGLVREGYLISNGLRAGRAYTATHKTKQLFGIAS